MENCPQTRLLRQKSIDKPIGAYYNVLAVITNSNIEM